MVFAASAPAPLSRSCPPQGTQCVARRHILRPLPQNAPPAPSLTPYIPKKKPAAYSSVQIVFASVIPPSRTISSARDTGIATRSMNSS